MRNWKQELHKARLFLAAHHPDLAIPGLRQALTACPMEMRKDLSQIYDLIGLAFHRLGMRANAVQSWTAACKIWKHARAARRLKTFAAVPLAHGAASAMTDWNRFYALQLARYRSAKRTQAIATRPELDMVNDLLYDHFRDLQQSGILDGKTRQQKDAIFLQVDIVFPLVTLDLAWTDGSR